MMKHIKICGLTTPESLNAALDGGATHVGFVFFQKSPRNIQPEEAGRLRKTAHGRAKAVAVTVDASDELLQMIVAEMRPDMLQLHGSETPTRVSEVKARWRLPVIKALPISESVDLEAMTSFRDAADLFLFDAKPPKDSRLPGGNGVSFDWRLLKKIDPLVDYLLSGGLNIDNVSDAIRIINPPGIDVSSGVESATGVKDVRLIEAFLEKVRASS